MTGLIKIILAAVLPSGLLTGCGSTKEQGAFPWELSAEKPNREMSAVRERNYDNCQEDNEFCSLFKYTEKVQELVAKLKAWEMKMGVDQYSCF